MKETRYFYVPEAENRVELPAEEALHAVKVLRLKEGDELFLMDGVGVFYRAEVSMIASRKCFYSITEKIPQASTWNGHIHLAIAPTKMMERMEWLVEKATEVGFDEITFLDTDFSERKTIRTDRIEKIVVSAMKQSRKPFLPKVNPLTPFLQFINTPHQGRLFIAHCYAEVARQDFFTSVYATPPAPITILVGPEGDFSIDEVREAVDKGYQSITLGESRLRTETAGLMAVTMAQIALRKET